MKIRSGWNSEPYGRRKFDIEVEEDDLRRILQANGIPLERADTMSVRDAYAILYCEAEVLSRAALARHYRSEGKPDETIEHVMAEIRALREEQETFLARYRPAAKVRETAPA